MHACLYDVCTYAFVYVHQQRSAQNIVSWRLLFTRIGEIILCKIKIIFFGCFICLSLSILFVVQMLSDIYKCMSIHTHTLMSKNSSLMHTWVCICAYGHKCIHMHLCVYIHTYVNKHTFVYILYVFVYLYGNTMIFDRFQFVYIHTHMCTHVYIQLCIHVCMHISTFTYMYVYVCIRIYMYIVYGFGGLKEL